MARAKRTNRAEARRRHRAQLAEQGNLEADPAPEPSPQPALRGRTPAATGGPPRTGMRYAFRAAFHPVNLRDDLAHLPELLRSRAVLIPVLVSLGSAIAIAATSGTDIVSRLLAQYFLVPPPIGAIFIAGFFAPRASYLAGGIVGLVSALALTGLIAFTPTLSPTNATPGTTPSPGPSASAGTSAGASALVSASPSSAASGTPAAATASPTAGASVASPAASQPASPAPSGTGTVAQADPLQVAGFALISSPIAGIFFASSAAWYRRFLQLSNPNRAAPRGAARGKPNNRRR